MVVELKFFQHYWMRTKWGHLYPPMYHYLILCNTTCLPMYFLQSLGVLQLVIVVKDMNLRAVNPDDHLLCHLLGNSLSSNPHLHKGSMWYLFHWIVEMCDMHMTHLQPIPCEWCKVIVKCAVMTKMYSAIHFCILKSELLWILGNGYCQL